MNKRKAAKKLREAIKRGMALTCPGCARYMKVLPPKGTKLVPAA